MEKEKYTWQDIEDKFIEFSRAVARMAKESDDYGKIGLVASWCVLTDEQPKTYRNMRTVIGPMSNVAAAISSVMQEDEPLIDTVNKMNKSAIKVNGLPNWTYKTKEDAK